MISNHLQQLKIEGHYKHQAWQHTKISFPSNIAHAGGLIHWLLFWVVKESSHWGAIKTRISSRYLNHLFKASLK